MGKIGVWKLIILNVLCVVWPTWHNFWCHPGWWHHKQPWCHQLHHSHMLAKAIKGAARCLLGFFSHRSSEGEVLVHAWIDVPACPHLWILYPSRIIDWVVNCCCSSCPPCGCLYTFWEWPGSATYLPTSTDSAGLPYLLLVPVCTVFIELISLHHRKCLVTEVAPSTSHITIVGIPRCVPTDTSGPNRGSCSTLIATQVFKCSYRKEGEEHHALIPRGLAGWIGMAMCMWQVADTALTQPC